MVEISLPTPFTGHQLRRFKPSLKEANSSLLDSPQMDNLRFSRGNLHKLQVNRLTMGKRKRITPRPPSMVNHLWMRLPTNLVRWEWDKSSCHSTRPTSSPRRLTPATFKSRRQRFGFHPIHAYHPLSLQMPILVISGVLSTQYLRRPPCKANLNFLWLSSLPPTDR